MPTQRCDLNSRRSTKISSRLVSLSLWPFLRVLSVTGEQYSALIKGTRQELRQAGLKLYLNL
jgi:hypothetical protein